MPGFLTSNLYYKYLSDLINSVRADEFVNMSTPGQGAPSDNDRTSSNAMEGSHIQVSCRYLWPTASRWHLDLFYGNNSTVTDETFDNATGLGSFVLWSCFTDWFRNVTLVDVGFSVCLPQQGSKKAVIKILKNFDEAITVDVASLDPESLYQRPYAG